jgi:Tol biopolymer transport system component
MFRNLALSGTSIALLAVVLTACTSAAPGPSHPTASSTAAASTGAVEAVPPGRLLFRRYSAADDSGSVLVVSDTRGGHEHQLTKASDKVVDGPYSWSPDGSRIVFTRHTGADMSGESFRLFTMSASGGSVKQLTFGRPADEGVLSKPQFDSNGSFSPDGKLIAYVHEDGKFDGSRLQHANVWIMKPDGSGGREVTKLKEYSGSVSGLGWSPDGTRLIYSFEQDPGGRALFIVNTDGTGNRRLTDWKLGANGIADWTSTGDLIVFRAVQDEESGIGNLYTIHPDGSGLTQITHLRNRVISHIVSFSPDGKWITSTDAPPDGGSEMFIARADGSRFRVIGHTAAATRATGAEWAPAG